MERKGKKRKMEICLVIPPFFSKDQYIPRLRDRFRKAYMLCFGDGMGACANTGNLKKTGSFCDLKRNKCTSVFFVCWPISSVQLLSHVWLFVTPWVAAFKASLSITNSWSLLKFMFIESVMPSNHLIPHCPLLLPPSIFPSIRVFKMSQFFASGGQSIGASASASASVLPMNIQDWFPSALTGWISLQSKGFSSIVSNTTVQKRQFFGGQLSL